jgi:hypothetical protein
MAKQLKDKNLAGRRISRALLAVSLTASIAAAGCTTNRNPGSGEPVRDGFVRTSPTGGVTSGSEMPLPPPMTSSYTGTETQRRNAYVGPDQAAAIMAQSGARMRVLGPVNPGPDTGIRPSSSVAQRNASIMNAPPQVTINSTINSPGTPVVIDGAGGVIDSGIVGAVTADGTIIGNSTAGTTTNTAPVFLNGNGTVAPTSVNSATLTPGAFAGGAAATPTATVSSVPPTTMTNSGTPVTVASNSTTGTTTAGTTGTTGTTATTAMNNSTITASTLAAATAGARVNRRATTATTTAASTATSAKSASAITSAATTSGTSVRIVRAGGRVLVTNVSSSSSNQ